MSRSKGSRRERELVNRLDDDGWVVLRAPASGSAASRELPDVIAGNGDVVIVGEAKTGDPDNVIYVEPEKVEGLEVVAEGLGGYPLVLVRWDQDTTWYWNSVEKIPRTPTGKLSVKDWESKAWRTIEELGEQLG